MRKGRLLSLFATVLLLAGCAGNDGDVTGSIAPTAKFEPKPLLPAPPPAELPSKPRNLAEPECKALVSQIQACGQRVKEKEKKASFNRRSIEIAETLASMEDSQRKATCKADLTAWRKDCGIP